ncbi:uncharacterized protein LOC141856825 [Brevipalpus obovatus]|uniref:uncharacterized protein LOC141856825 n=1 Tax=Brevipalpus obovatus TaxID=246614 RepID=UPI003D9EFC2A
MKFASVLAILLVFMANSQATVIEIKDFSEWKQRLTYLTDNLQDKLYGPDKSRRAKAFDQLRNDLNKVKDIETGMMMENALFELYKEQFGLDAVESTECRFGNANFECLLIR